MVLEVFLAVKFKFGKKALLCFAEIGGFEPNPVGQVKKLNGIEIGICCVHCC